MSGAPAAERRAAAELEAAVEQLSPKDFAEGLKAVARKLPVAAGVETAAIRLRDTDGEGELHLVSSEGNPAHERQQETRWLAADFGDMAPFRIEIWIEQHFGPPGGDVDRIGEQRRVPDSHHIRLVFRAVRPDCYLLHAD